MNARAAEGWIAILNQAIARPRTGMCIVTLMAAMILDVASARQNQPANNTPGSTQKGSGPDNSPGNNQKGSGPDNSPGDTNNGLGGNKTPKDPKQDPIQPMRPIGPKSPPPTGADAEQVAPPPALPWVRSIDGGGNGILLLAHDGHAAYLVTSIDALGFESGERTVHIETYECTLPDGTRLSSALQGPVDSYRFRVLPEDHAMSALCAIRLEEVERRQLDIGAQGDPRRLCFRYHENMSGVWPGGSAVTAMSYALRPRAGGLRWQSASASWDPSAPGALAPALPGSFDAAPLMTTATEPDSGARLALIGSLDAEGEGDAMVVHAWSSLRDLLDDARTEPITDARALSHFLRHHWKTPDSYRRMASWAIECEFGQVAHWRTVGLDHGKWGSRFEAHLLIEGTEPDPRLVCAASEATGEDMSLELSNTGSSGIEVHPALDAAVAIADPRTERNLRLVITDSSGGNSRVLVIEAAKRPNERLGPLPSPSSSR